MAKEKEYKVKYVTEKGTKMVKTLTVTEIQNRKKGGSKILNVKYVGYRAEEKKDK